MKCLNTLLIIYICYIICFEELFALWVSIAHIKSAADENRFSHPTIILINRGNELIGGISERGQTIWLKQNLFASTKKEQQIGADEGQFCHRNIMLVNRERTQAFPEGVDRFGSNKILAKK